MLNTLAICSKIDYVKLHSHGGFGVSDKIDLRVLKTRENIKNTFSSLLLEKDFKNITVQNVCDRALIGRSTFYDHYCDKYDLLNKMVEEIISEFKPYLKSRFDLNNLDDFTKVGVDVLKLFSKKKNTIKALINVHTEAVDLYDELKKLLIEGCSCHLNKSNFVSKYNISNEYICGHYASFVLTSFQLWIELGENENNLQLANKMHSILFEGVDI